ncbi:hypothetical protein [Roseofilum casamattae]|uniref:Uncharacterized protein n=1 Tax=Roseofilum casamattae BLCC-M143 TaxID=3022442 RepID=A0ABT7C2N3_9CYAN|nr:hypothetical protein [Roseofilum casamattae]MDJ1185713.1 hypothetical protein [Roseofilum casamattae BLCC-M143]
MKPLSSLFKLGLLAFSLAPFAGLFLAQPARGQYQYQNPSVPLPSILPLDIQLVTETEEGIIPESDRNSTITENTINPTSITLPSLWWAAEQHRGKLLVTWLAYPSSEPNSPGRVDLVVNRQIWRETCYFNRYEFVTKLGAIARDYGYNTRIFNRQGTTLAAYTCNFQTPNFCNVQGLVITQGVNQDCVAN